MWHDAKLGQDWDSISRGLYSVQDIHALFMPLHVDKLKQDHYEQGACGDDEEDVGVFEPLLQWPQLESRAAHRLTPAIHDSTHQFYNLPLSASAFTLDDGQVSIPLERLDDRVERPHDLLGRKLDVWQLRQQWAHVGVIGIGTLRLLPHHQTCGSASGGSRR